MGLWILIPMFFLLLILGVPIAYVLLTTALVGAVGMLGINAQIITQSLFNYLNSYTILAVPFFIISGGIAAKGGTAKSLVNFFKHLLGWLPGGLGIATVATCAFFAAISGSSLATIIAVGTLMIPTLVDEGYPEGMAVGMVNSAGSLGILIPPSIPMVTICVAMDASVGQMFSAGFGPGILLAIVWCLYVSIKCKRKHIAYIPKEERKKDPYTLRAFLHDLPALLFPVVILGSIYAGIATPTEAAAISIVYVVIIETLVYKTTKIAELPKIVGKSVIEAGTMTILLGASGPVAWLVSNLQIPAKLAAFCTTYIPNHFVFILALIGILFVLGCFMDCVAVIVILGPMLADSLAAFGIPTSHFGIIAIMCTQIGLITPPFGMNLFCTMKVAKKSMGEVVMPSLPYLGLLVATALLIAFCQPITMTIPRLLYGG